jgi:diguanylate cyclase (GGDEF)-like protein
VTGGISLDVPTLYIVSAMVISLTGILFIVDAYSRRDDSVGRIWSLAYIAGVVTTFAYLASSLYDTIWWGVGLGNGTVVFSIASVWAGARLFNGKRSLLWVGAAASVFVMLSAVVLGPDGGVWAGGGFMIGGMCLFGLLGGIECFRGSLWRYRNARFLGAATMIAGAYYGVRLIFFVSQGPNSEFFSRFLGTGITSLIVIVFVVGGAFSMVALRGEESAQTYSSRADSDGLSGTIGPQQFTDVATGIIAEAQGSGRPTAFVAVDIDELGMMNAAFGRSFGDDVLERFVDTLRAALPAGSPLCRVSADNFEFVLRNHDAAGAARLAERIRSSLVDSPLVAESGVRVTASFGIAVVANGDDSLERMRQAAVAAVEQAKSEGGNRVQEQPGLMQ